MELLPPRWIDRLLAWYCHPDLLEDLQGDLYELYQAKRSVVTKRKANLLYLWWVIRSFRWSALKWTQQASTQKLKDNKLMTIFQNIKVSWRVLKRDTFNTTLNVLGLAIGITCFVLLGLYVRQEVTFDSFHDNKDRIYRAWLHEDYGDGAVFFNSTTPFLFEGIFEKDFPEVETAVQFTLRNYHVGREDRLFNEPVGIISPEFFDVFDFSIVDGRVQKPLFDKDQVILSRSFASKYFGDNPAVGSTVGIQLGEDLRQFVVSAVLEDMPINSSIRFELAISSENNKDIFGERALNGWTTVAPETYVLIKEGATIESVNAKSQDVVMSYLADEMERDQYTIGFQPLTDIHLNPDIPIGNAPVSNPKYVYVLGVIGLLVLIIAAINYTTLSVGQSLRRSKEVGMRKVLGANRSLLISQYLTESILIASVAMGVGTITAILLIPAFNSMTGAELHYQFLWWHAGIYLAIGLLIGAISGLYPVAVLSSGRAAALIQGNKMVSTNHLVRKGLMVFQFVITVFLISSALVMKRQLDYLHQMDLGYKTEAVISIPLFPDPQAGNLPERIVSAQRNADLLKEKFSQNPSFTNMTTATHVFGSNGWANLAFTDKKGNFRRFRFLAVDPSFMEAFDIPVEEGRDFEEGNGLDSRQSIILNETAVAYFGLENPIGKKLPGANFGEHQIIGVVKDFHYGSLHNKIEPLVITQNVVPIFRGISDGDVMDSMIPNLLLTYESTDLTQLKGILTEVWESTFPAMPLEYRFLDERIAALYESEERMKGLVNVAMIVALIVASIGLLGLSVLVTNSRQKEIGIRKVLGANVGQVFGIMARAFSWQLGLGIILSAPLTIYLMSSWLEDFTYRIQLRVDIFLISGIATLVVSGLVISYHTIKAARSNPVKSLRTE